MHESKYAHMHASRHASPTVCLSARQIVPECDVAGPTSYYWYRVALDASPGLQHTDGIKWKMLLCLLFSWFVVYLCICKGIKSSGKVGTARVSPRYVGGVRWIQCACLVDLWVG